MHQPDEGTILWDGEPVSLGSPQAAIKSGIATIYQELDLVPDLSVAENIFLGHELVDGGFSQRLRANRLRSRPAHPARPPRDLADPQPSARSRRPASRSSAWRGRCPATPGC